MAIGKFFNYFPDQMTAKLFSMRIQGGCLLVWFICSLNCPAQVVLDFSHSRDIGVILNSGIKTKPVNNSSPGQSSLIFQNETVKLILPGGGSFTIHVSIGTAKFKEANIDSLLLNGEQMPTDQAYLLMGTLHDTFRIPQADLEKWFGVASTNWSAGSSYTSAIPNSEPRVYFRLLSSHHRLYPQFPQISVAWNLYKGKDRSAVPPPFAEPLELSLNAPSGKRYDRNDGVDVAAVEAFGKELVEKFPVQTAEFLRKTGQTQAEETVPPSRVAGKAAIVTVKKIVDWKVVSGLIGVAVALALLIRHRLKREKLP